MNMKTKEKVVSKTTFQPTPVSLTLYRVNTALRLIMTVIVVAVVATLVKIIF